MTEVTRRMDVIPRTVEAEGENLDRDIYAEKRKIIPEDWKGNIDEIISRELHQANRYFANFSAEIVAGIQREASRSPEVFYSRLRERWDWHNEFYENFLEPAMLEIVEERDFNLSPRQIDLLKKVYEVSSLVDRATLCMSGAIKKHAEYWLKEDKTYPLSGEQVNQALTMDRESFWTQYFIDHIEYFIKLKKGESQEAEEAKNKLLQEYHINDEKIFQGRIKKQFEIYQDKPVEELESLVQNMKTSPNDRVQAFYLRLERPRLQALVKSLEYDNIDEYKILKSLIGISGFVLRKRILQYLDNTHVCPNDGAIYGLDDKDIIEGLEKIKKYREQAMAKDVSHISQDSEPTCVSTCGVMVLHHFGLSDLTRDQILELHKLVKSGDVEGAYLSALAKVFSEKGLEVELVHSEEKMFKNENNFFDPKVFEKLMEEYSQFLAPEQYVINNGYPITNDSIKEYLQNDFIVVLAGQTGGAVLHAIVVVGYNEKGFVVHDPLYNKSKTVPYSQIKLFAQTPIGSWMIAARKPQEKVSDLRSVLDKFSQEATNLLQPE